MKVLSLSFLLCFLLFSSSVVAQGNILVINTPLAPLTKNNVIASRRRFRARQKYSAVRKFASVIFYHFDKSSVSRDFSPKIIPSLIWWGNQSIYEHWVLINKLKASAWLNSDYFFERRTDFFFKMSSINHHNDHRHYYSTIKNHLKVKKLSTVRGWVSWIYNTNSMKKKKKCHAKR